MVKAPWSTPPWTGDDTAMFAWLIDQLDDQMAADIERANAADDVDAVLHWMAVDGPGLEAAWQGDIEPLRHKYPHLAMVLHPPKLGRGQKYKKPPKQWDGDREARLQAAAEDVPRIKKLWDTHYLTTRRPRGAKSAEWFAARRWSYEDVVLTEAEVIKALRSKGLR